MTEVYSARPVEALRTSGAAAQQTMGAGSSANATDCYMNCSGRGSCDRGTCLCHVWFTGGACVDSNAPYFYSFGTFFYFLSFVTLMQLICRIYVESKDQDRKKARETTIQKLLYSLIVGATAVRGTYFIAKMYIPEEWSVQLMTAYYPLLISCFSLLVCFWGEVFHVNDTSYEGRPGFLSKSYSAFVLFNGVIYLLLVMQIICSSFIQDKVLLATIADSLNGLYAGVMLVLLLFFLIYGVKMFFMLRGAFTEWRNERLNEGQLKMSRLGLLSQAGLQLNVVFFLALDIGKDLWHDKVAIQSQNYYDIFFHIFEFGVALWFPCVLWNWKRPEQLWVLNPGKILQTTPSILGSRIVSDATGCESESLVRRSASQRAYDTFDTASLPDSAGECWICYDRNKVDGGLLIQPCNCKGDLSTVHHECLRKWLLECKDTDYRCKVCGQEYRVVSSPISGDRMSLASCLRRRDMLISVLLLVIAGAVVPTATCAVCAYATTSIYLRLLAIGVAIVSECVLCKFLGFSLVEAWRKIRVEQLQILG